MTWHDDHGLCPSGHRAKDIPGIGRPNPARRSAPMVGRAAPRTPTQPRTADRADQARRRHPGARSSERSKTRPRRSPPSRHADRSRSRPRQPAAPDATTRCARSPSGRGTRRSRQLTRRRDLSRCAVSSPLDLDRPCGCSSDRCWHSQSLHPSALARPVRADAKARPSARSRSAPGPPGRSTGTADIDPYARALVARSGELPIGAGDGVAFSHQGRRRQPARWPLRRGGLAASRRRRGSGP